MGVAVASRNNVGMVVSDGCISLPGATAWQHPLVHVSSPSLMAHLTDGGIQRVFALVCCRLVLNQNLIGKERFRRQKHSDQGQDLNSLSAAASAVSIVG